MSKRIELTDEELTEVKSAISIVLETCYNEEWVEDQCDKDEAISKRNRLQTIFKKL